MTDSRPRRWGFEAREGRRSGARGRLEAAVRLTLRRLAHPVETARMVATRVLPVRVRARLVRLARVVGKRDAALPALGPEALAALAGQGLGVAGAPRRPAILCLPMLEWRDRYQRPQQMLSLFATRGWPVLVARLVPGVPGQKVFLEEHPLAPGVWSLCLPLRWPPDRFRDRMEDVHRAVLVSLLLDARVQLRLADVVVLCQLPFWWPVARELRDQLGWPVVYDRMDMHRGFAATDERAIVNEGDLVRGADVVWVVSRALEEYSSAARRIALIHNGCDWPHWSAPGPPPPDLPRSPIIGFYGAIAEWFDADLIRRLALARREWSFLLIGSTWGIDASRLAALPNVHLTGELPYDVLPAYAARFDVGLIPFRRLPLTVAGDPVKLYEMLALGIDIVSTPVPEVEPFGDLIELAEGFDATLAAIERCLARPVPAELAARRRQRALATSWEVRVCEAETTIVDLYPLVSIVIASFGNRELTRLCLESIWRCTEYPRYEIVVVDNASPDATVDMLRELAAAHPAMQVVANPTNRGFAAATNQGVRLARGEVLCLLNNDTVVTSGWLTRLVAAVQRDPGLGMVGPVSNAVANEARVEVRYDNVVDMPGWAASFVWKHDGEAFEMKMLALFCAVLRRAVWEQVGELDEQFGLGMFEDDDYCRRLHAAGLTLRCRRDVFVHHWQRAGFRVLGDDAYWRLYEENRARFLAKWKDSSASADLSSLPADPPIR